MIKNF